MATESGPYRSWIVKISQYALSTLLAVASGALLWIALEFGSTSLKVIEFYVADAAEYATSLESRTIFSALAILVISAVVAVSAQRTANKWAARRGRARSLVGWLPTLALVPIVSLAATLSLIPVEPGRIVHPILTASPGKVEEVNNRHNIIHIFIESLSTEVEVVSGSKAYLDINGFLPWSVTTSLPELPDHTHTIAGMVASMCGLEFSGAAFSDVEDQRHLSKNDMCLTDVLKQNSYTLQYLGGADLTFQQKGEFLAKHGVSALGKSAWENLGETRMSSWGQGLHDSRLFARAKSQIKFLASMKEPFYLALLTLDGHYPYYKDPGCPLKGPSNNEAVSFSCTLLALNEFLGWLSRSGMLENTIVIVQGDHLPLKANRDDGTAGQIAFFARLPESTKIENLSTPGSITEIKRMILDSLG